MRVILSGFAALTLAHVCSGADINDDFSKADWKRFSNTPGELVQKTNEMTLVDAKGAPGWVTAWKNYSIDLDKTPYLILKISKLSRRGQVKLINNGTKDKKEVLSVTKPGIYSVNIPEKCAWKGTISLTACLYALGEGSSISYEYLKFSDKAPELLKEKEEKTPLELSAVPLFNSCGYYYPSAKQDKSLQVKFRVRNGSWQNAFPPVWISDDKVYRGSIVNLQENTDYELAIYSGDKLIKTLPFKTWSSDVKIGKTIILNKDNFKDILKVSEKGTENAWIKYKAAPGFILKNDGKYPLLDISKAEYIIFEGLTLQGGDSCAVYVKYSKFIRFVNCDFSGWGIVGTQRFDKDGKFYDDKGKAINYNGGIFLTKSFGTVVERCYFHDPRNAANSWRYSHPAGPEAMMIDKPQSTVLRYNDFIGSNEHRWNDAVEGTGNFHNDGGFNRDADIYGNMMAFGNDDAIEIDGGQQNVRVFLNKMEGFLCGVSIQGCMEGPSYVFNNLIINLGDEFGSAGQTIKTSSNRAGKDAFSYIFHNTSDGKGISLSLNPLMNIVAKNNIFATVKGMAHHESKKADADFNFVKNGKPGDEKNGISGKDPGFTKRADGIYTLDKNSPAAGKGSRLDNFNQGDKIDMGAIQSGSRLILPYRPIPVELDKYQMIFDKKSSGGTFTATISGKDFSSEYSIRKNNVSDWFSVSPAAGTFKSGDKLTFQVKLNREKMTKDHLYMAVFLVRLKDGYSRPVTVYAYTDNLQQAKPHSDKSTTVYIEAEKPSGGKAYEVRNDPNASGGKYVAIDNNPDGSPRTEAAEYTFDLPRDDRYYVLMRIRSEEPVGSHDSLSFAIDGEDMKDAHMRGSTTWNWAQSANNNQRMMNLRAIDLKKGKHKIKILPRESLYLDMIAVSTDPKNFEFK